MQIRDEMDRAAIICKAAKSEPKGDYRIYESYKKKLAALKLTRVQYETAIEVISRNLGV